MRRPTRCCPPSPGNELEQEITGSRTTLADAIGQPITSIAYPFGTPESYGPNATRLARRAGYERGCANVAGAVRRRTPRFELPPLHDLRLAGRRVRDPRAGVVQEPVKAGHISPRRGSAIHGAARRVKGSASACLTAELRVVLPAARHHETNASIGTPQPSGRRECDRTASVSGRDRRATTRASRLPSRARRRERPATNKASVRKYTRSQSGRPSRWPDSQSTTTNESAVTMMFQQPRSVVLQHRRDRGQRIVELLRRSRRRPADLHDPIGNGCDVRHRETLVSG